MAGWQSGYAPACKAVYLGSIPGPASILYRRPAHFCPEYRSESGYVRHNMLYTAKSNKRGTGSSGHSLQNILLAGAVWQQLFQFPVLVNHLAQ